MESRVANSGGDGAVDGIGWRGLVGRGPLHRVRAMPSTKARAVLQGFKQKTVGAEGGIRTHTGRLCPTVFETVASTIPPLRHIRVRVTKTSVFDGLAVCARRAARRQRVRSVATGPRLVRAQRSVASDDPDVRRCELADLSCRI